MLHCQLLSILRPPPVGPRWGGMAGRRHRRITIKARTALVWRRASQTLRRVPVAQPAVTRGTLLTPLHHLASLRYSGERDHQYACSAFKRTTHGQYTHAPLGFQGGRGTGTTTATPHHTAIGPTAPLMPMQAVAGGMLGSVYTIVTSYLINHNQELREPIALSESTARAPCSQPNVLTAHNGPLPEAVPLPLSPCATAPTPCTSLTWYYPLCSRTDLPDGVRVVLLRDGLRGLLHGSGRARHLNLRAAVRIHALAPGSAIDCIPYGSSIPLPCSGSAMSSLSLCTSITSLTSLARAPKTNTTDPLRWSCRRVLALGRAYCILCVLCTLGHLNVVGFNSSALDDAWTAGEPTG